MITGVDVSSFQGDPRNWRPIAGNIAYAGVKLTEYSAGARKYQNPFAGADWQALKAAGLGRIAYMFGHPSAPPKASADYFLSVLHSLGFTDGDMVALDHEVSDGLTPAACSEWAQAVLGELEHQTGRAPLLYTFRAFADEGCCAGLGKYHLWLADPSSPPGHPSVPAPWHDWAIHQHSISAPIDRDVAQFPDLKSMRSALGRKVPSVIISSWKADGKLSLAQLAAEHGTACSTVLRLTALHGEHSKFDAPTAAYIDAVFKGSLAPAEPVPAGAMLWVPRP